MKSMKWKKRGSVLVGTIGIATIGASVIAGYLTMSLNEYKLSQRTSKLQAAMNLAEAGLELGMNSINTKDWTGWTSVGSDGYFRDVTNITFADSRVARIRVYVEDYDDLPILVSEGCTVEPDGSEIFKQVRVDMETSSLFANGMTAKNTINFNGNPVTIDAYDSRLGPWNAILNRDDVGSVASLSVDNGALDVGNGDIWGYLATGGGSYDIGPKGSVRGEDTPSGVKEDPDRISYDFDSSLPDVSVPSLTVDHTTLAPGDIGDASASWSSDPDVYYLTTNFNVTSSDKINVVGPTVIITEGDFVMTGQSELNIIGSDAYLKIYVAGDLTVTGVGALNDQLKPDAFQVWGTAPAGTSQNISVKGNGELAGVVYAPNAQVDIVGTSSVSGAIVGEDITVTGSTAFHYDVNLKNLDNDGSFRIKRWRELRGNTEWLNFDSASALASAISPL